MGDKNIEWPGEKNLILREIEKIRNARRKKRRDE